MPRRPLDFNENFDDLERWLPFLDPPRKTEFPDTMLAAFLLEEPSCYNRGLKHLSKKWTYHSSKKS